jgi:hypothetical protein
MNKLLSLAIIAILSAGQISAQTISRADYIARYKHLAIAHAEKYGIPASIKMAQAMLESGNGNGPLAVEGNTHFNIKVKASDNWRGSIVYHDDDAPGEAFRAYATPEDSWIDHSVYLDTQIRYDSLFRYSVTDYRSWARGLKNCGYATDPAYAEKLIRLIEDNRLWELDLAATGAHNVSAGATIPASTAGSHSTGSTTAGSTPHSTSTPGGTAVLGDGWGEVRGVNIDEAEGSTPETSLIDIDNFTVAMYYSGGRDLLRTQHGRFIVAKEGDTLRTISRLTGIRVGLLSRYNRLEKHTPLSAGQRIKIG